MEGSQFDAIKKAWRERNDRNKQEEIERKNNAMDKASRMASYLKTRYRVQKVYLFGSLLWGKHFTVSSDIDLLVIGFPASEDFWEALAAVEHIAMPFPVSLVLADDASPSLRGKVEREGLSL